MKEKTLYHLMIATGSAMVNRLSDPVLQDQIDEVRQTLDVSSTPQGTYLITFVRGGERGEVEIPKNLFDFHVRGDVKRLVDARPVGVDLRSKNWAAALDVWGRILRGRLLPDSVFKELSSIVIHRGRKFSPIALLLAVPVIAPFAFGIPSLAVGWLAGLSLFPGVRGRILYFSVLMASALGLAIHCESNTAIRLILAILFFRVSHEIGRRRGRLPLPALAMVTICAIAAVVDSGILLAFGISLVLEGLTAILRQRKKFAVVLATGGGGLIIGAVTLGDLRVADTGTMLFLVVSGFVLTCAVIPFGIGPNTARISSVIALSVSGMLTSNGLGVWVVVMPLVIAVQIIQTFRPRSKTGRTRDVTAPARRSETPVSIRRRGE